MRRWQHVRYVFAPERDNWLQFLNTRADEGWDLIDVDRAQLWYCTFRRRVWFWQL